VTKDLTITLPDDAAKAACWALLMVIRSMDKAGSTPKTKEAQDHLVTAVTLITMAGVAADEEEAHADLDEVAADRAAERDADLVLECLVSRPKIVWGPGDIATLRENWTMEQCEAFLDRNREHIVARSIELGWGVIETLLDEEGDA